MSTLFPHAYRRLIQEDIDWLKSVPRTLERDHIIMILEMEKEHTFAYSLKSNDDLHANRSSESSKSKHNSSNSE